MLGRTFFFSIYARGILRKKLRGLFCFLLANCLGLIEQKRMKNNAPGPIGNGMLEGV